LILLSNCFVGGSSEGGLMSRVVSGLVGMAVCLAMVLAVAAPVNAASVPALGKDAAVIVDGLSGRVLYERNANEIRYPASLTKMMTLYLLFEAFENGTLTYESELPTSSFAASQSPTKMNLRPGETISAKTAMEAIVVRSANDVAVVVAEALGGTEAGFARLMTQKAGELGMLNTHFANASGLPDAQQISTAADMALLGRRLAYDFPQYYPFLSITEFQFKGRTYGGHNNLLGAFEGTDGIKTGYTRASGFNLVTSVVRGNKHVVGVVMGGTTAVSRDNEMKRLISIAFDEIDKNPLLVAYANVPWRNGDGPKTFPSWTTTPPPPVVLAAFGESRPSSRAPAPRAVVLAVAPPGNAVIPQQKPLLQLASATTTETFTGDDLIASLSGAEPELRGGSVGLDGTSSVAAERIATMLPTPKPVIPTVSVASFVPRTPLLPTPAPRRQSAGADTRWAIQIGVFANEDAAAAQLAVAAERSMDVLGQAQRLVIPFTGEGGRTLYRARFGLFAEGEARAVCQRMMARGETCFASQHVPGT
jgi:D-alanyl-D-alanine carboxypeptidase